MSTRENEEELPGGGGIVQQSTAGAAPAADRETTPVAGFHPDGSGVPVFFIRTWFNELPAYEMLAHHLGDDQPIYTIAPPRGTRREDMPPTAEAWSDFCLERLREVGYGGPYVLGGWSFGGVVALEMARTLRAKGAEIRRVLMIDTWRPRHRTGNRGTLGTIVLHLNRMAELAPAARREYVRKRVRKKLHDMRIRLRRTGGEARAEQDGYGVDHVATNRGMRISLLQRAVWVCHYKYRSLRSDLPVSLYWSSGSRDANNDSALGWIPTLYGEFESVQVPGDHFTLFDEPHVATLAALMKRTLDGGTPAGPHRPLPQNDTN